MGFSGPKVHFSPLTLLGRVQRICSHSPVVGCMSIRGTISGYTNTCWAFLWLHSHYHLPQRARDILLRCYRGESSSLVWTQRALEWFSLIDRAHTTLPREVQIFLLGRILYRHSTASWGLSLSLLPFPGRLHHSISSLRLDCVGTINPILGNATAGKAVAGIRSVCWSLEKELKMPVQPCRITALI